MAAVPRGATESGRPAASPDHLAPVFDFLVDAANQSDGVHGEQAVPWGSVEGGVQLLESPDSPISKEELANRSTKASSSNTLVPRRSAAAIFEPGDSPTTR